MQGMTCAWHTALDIETVGIALDTAICTGLRCPRVSVGAIESNCMILSAGQAQDTPMLFPASATSLPMGL